MRRAEPWYAFSVARSGFAWHSEARKYFILCCTHATHTRNVDGVTHNKQLTLHSPHIRLVRPLATMFAPSAVVPPVSTPQLPFGAPEHQAQLTLDLERCEHVAHLLRIRQLRARERERVNSRQMHIARRIYELRRFAQPLDDGELVQTFLPDQGEKLLSSAKVKAGLDIGCWYFQPQRSGGDDYLTHIDRQVLLSLFILRRNRRSERGKLRKAVYTAKEEELTRLMPLALPVDMSSNENMPRGWADHCARHCGLDVSGVVVSMNLFGTRSVMYVVGSS